MTKPTHDWRAEQLQRHANTIKAISEAHVDAGKHRFGFIQVDHLGNLTRVNQKKVKVTLEIL